LCLWLFLCISSFTRHCKKRRKRFTDPRLDFVLQNNWTASRRGWTRSTRTWRKQRRISQEWRSVAVCVCCLATSELALTAVYHMKIYKITYRKYKTLYQWEKNQSLYNDRKINPCTVEALLTDAGSIARQINRPPSRNKETSAATADVAIMI
jgi:hypothetical protein